MTSDVAAYLISRRLRSQQNSTTNQRKTIMTTSITLMTPEFLKAEIEARYGSPRRRGWRQRSDASLRIAERAHRRRTSEAPLMPRPARAH